MATCVANDDGYKAVLAARPRSKPTDHLDVVASSASRSQDALTQPKQADGTQQVVQGRQRRQVFYDGGRVVEEAPAGIRPLDLPHQGARKAAAWCQLSPSAARSRRSRTGAELRPGSAVRAGRQ